MWGKEDSGNLALSKERPGYQVVYDRGELLYLCARAIIELDACPEALAKRFDLTQPELMDVLSMAD